MMLFTGQPVWQNGTPQSMQRAACVRTLSSRKRLIDLEIVVHALVNGAARRAVSRAYSIKPVTLPTDHLSARPWFRRLRGHHARGHSRNPENALVLVRENLDELRQRGFPVFNNPFGLRARREFAMPRDQLVEYLDIVLICNRLEVYLGAIALLFWAIKVRR